MSGSPAWPPAPGQAARRPRRGRACACPRSRAPARPAKRWVMGSRCWRRRTASSLDAAETPPARASQGSSGTRPCGERFVPPLLSHPRAAGKEKPPRLAEAQNPWCCCKSALCVCHALQTLGVRAVPAPLWVATVWEIRAEKQSRAGKELEPSERIGRNSPGARSTGRSRSPCPSRRESGSGPPRVAQRGVRGARGGHRSRSRGEAARFWGSRPAPQRGLPSRRSLRHGRA